MRHTKIVATVGPATRSEEALTRMVRAGVDVFRLNFSHGSPEEHTATIRAIRRVSEREDRAVAVLQDLQGPRLRTGALAGPADTVVLLPGQYFTLTTEPLPHGGNIERAFVNYRGLAHDLQPNNRVLIADGALELRVVSTTDTEVLTVVVRGGQLGERKGINVPGIALSVSSPTEKDLEDLSLGVALGIDYVAISFVSDARQVEETRRALERLGAGDVPVIAKLERAEVLTNLDAILAASDAVMVARGDLGVELGPEKVPILQKVIIRRANEHRIPSITATQMLESMINSMQPTRAEASDVANAILDGTDALMLSGETAIGRYSAEAVQTMDRIAREVESSGLRVDFQEVLGDDAGHDHSLSHGAAALAEEVGATAIVVYTASGHTARLLSKERSSAPIYAFTPSRTVYQRLALWHGVTPLLADYVDDSEVLIQNMFAELRHRKLVNVGDDVVVARLAPPDEPTRTNFITIRTVTAASGTAATIGSQPVNP
ncbi:MAG: pyruvate kinase [Chloroflexi bacterium]|nr:pyruvate kinase [Chloroflexota bacterium]